MWFEKGGRLPRHAEVAPEGTLPVPVEMSPEMLGRCLADAERRRSEAVTEILCRLGAWLMRACRSGRRGDAEASTAGPDYFGLVEHELTTPLTSIRSAAEIIRDNAGLPVEDRNRLLDVVLEDNRRLERFVARLLAGMNAGSRWRGGPGCKSAAEESCQKQSA